MPPSIMLVQAFVIAIAATAGWLLARANKKACVAGAVAAIAIGLFGRIVQARPDLLASIIPWCNVLFFSNLYPYAVALGIPCLVALCRNRAQKIRVGVLLAVLFAVSWANSRIHFLPQATSYGTVIDDDGICRQSSVDTCSAVAIVTLLGQHGISITEADAIELARTKHRRGTTRLGVYRALAIAGREKKLRTRLERITADELLASNQPAIIMVGLPGDAPPEFGKLYDWQPGVLHEVVFLGMNADSDDHVRIGEPDYGLEHWPVDHLKILFQGYAAWLE